MKFIDDSIRQQIGDASLLEQLAEESSELAQAALKKARILRGKNPTPVTIETANENLVEEFSDVSLCARLLHLRESEDISSSKWYRWKKRLEDCKKDTNPQIVYIDLPYSEDCYHCSVLVKYSGVTGELQQWCPFTHTMITDDNQGWKPNCPLKGVNNE